MGFSLYIKIILKAEHIYIDATFITKKDYYQLLIIMAYNKLLDLKVPCIYALMNNGMFLFFEIWNNIFIYMRKIKNIIRILAFYYKKIWSNGYCYYFWDCQKR